MCPCCKDKLNNQETTEQQTEQLNLGQSMFTLHNQIDLTSEVGDGCVTDLVMMDNGTLVMCLILQNRLVTCNTDGSQVDSVHVQGGPLCVTAVNNVTVAVALDSSQCIEMYDIYNKLKIKSISVPEMLWLNGISVIHNRLVVCGNYRIMIIDYQAAAVVQIIQTDCIPMMLHSSAGKIFYSDNINKNLYWYSSTDFRHHTLTLPSAPDRITTLQDGSLYVGCSDRSLQHVSSDGQQYKTVKTNELQESKNLFLIYNSNQRKLVKKDDQKTIFKIFNEI